MDLYYHIKSYLSYRLKAWHRSGFGIHSPFVFHFLNFVLFEKLPFYAYGKIEECRRQFLKRGDELDVIDYGIGNFIGKKKVCDVAKRSLKRPKYAQLLFRMVHFSSSNYILELGTSLGVTTMYLAAPKKTAQVVTVDGCSAYCAMASEQFKRNGFDNITITCCNLDDGLDAVLERFPQLDFVFFDANHRKSATLNYFGKCLQKAHQKTIFVIDDIHHSKEMEEAWLEMKRNPVVHLSLDIYEMGILFFNVDLPKQDYVVSF